MTSVKPVPDWGHGYIPFEPGSNPRQKFRGGDYFSIFYFRLPAVAALRLGQGGP